MPERERGQTLVSVVKKRDERLRPSHTTCPLMRSLPARRACRGSCGANAWVFASPRSRRDSAPRSSRNRGHAVYAGRGPASLLCNRDVSTPGNSAHCAMPSVLAIPEHVVYVLLNLLNRQVPLAILVRTVIAYEKKEAS